ncbi:MAG: RHS repeat protein [Acidobacteria bacterium]|nr:RHS repeat protein [Acidobacteriota bacterium]
MAQNSSHRPGRGWLIGVVLMAICSLVGFFALDYFLPAVSDAKRFEHDAQGNLRKLTTPNGRVITYRYDRAGQVTEIAYGKAGKWTGWNYPGGGRVKFDYDLAGNCTTMKDALGRTAFAYDEFNRLQEITYANGKKLAYEYDPWGQVRRLTLPENQRIAYNYDLLGNLTEVSDGQTAIRYEYDGANHQIIRRLPNGITTTKEFSPTGRLLALRHRQADGTPLCAFQYQYDAEDRITEITETAAHATFTTRYEYDLSGHLMQVSNADGLTVAYRYDAIGNRVAQTDANGTIQYSYDARGRLLRAGTATFTYDANGNLLTSTDGAKRATYQYDEANRLTQVRNNQGVIRYAYDGNGNRVRREVNGKSIEYLNDVNGEVTKVVAQYDKSGTLSHYLSGSERLALRNDKGKVVYLLEDHLGSTRCVVDERGAVVARYQYTPFGAPILEAGNAQTDFLYTGEQWDEEAQLLYLRSRFYDPQLGRFLSPDSQPGVPTEPESFNQYAYVNNDPINLLDPTGMQGWPPPPYYNPTYNPFRYPIRFPPIPTARYPVQPHSYPYYLAREFGGALVRGELFHANTDNQRYLRAIARWVPVARDVIFGNDILYDLTHDRKGAALTKLTLRGLQGELKSRQSAGLFSRGESTLVSGLQYGARGVGTFTELADTNLFRRGYTTFDNWFHRRTSDSLSSLNQPSLLSSERNKTIYFPPGGGGGGGGVPRVGGVYLDQAAKVIGEMGAINGAMYDRDSGQLILVGEKNTALPPLKPEYLAAAMRAVYSASPYEPGMTIDPHPQNPMGPTMLVKFFGNTENTRLGWVMFECDRLMKGYSVGADNITREKVTSAVPDYRSLAEMSFTQGHQGPELWNRFWLVPEPVTAHLNEGGNAILFDPVKLRVKTETMQWSGGKLVSAGGIRDPQAEAFAAHFTSHYEEFANEHPTFAELKQVTQAVAIAKWMYSQNIPADWNFVQLFAPYPTPQITPSAFYEQTQTQTTGRGTLTRRLTSFGGVDMEVRLQTDSNANQFGDEFKKAWAAARQQDQAAFDFQHHKKTYVAVALFPGQQRELASFSAVESEIADWLEVANELPGLARYYNSSHNEASEFGHSWSMLLPRLEFERPQDNEAANASERYDSAHSEATVAKRLQYVQVEGNAATRTLVQRFHLTDPFGLRQERFDEYHIDQGLQRIVFIPKNPQSNFQALYAESGGLYRLITATHQQWLFDSTGRLRAVLTDDCQKNRAPNSSTAGAGAGVGVGISKSASPQGKTASPSTAKASSMAEKNSSSATATEHDFSTALYDYNAAGQLAQISFSGCLGVSWRLTFEYDDAGRLIAISSGQRKTHYEYDEAGNLAHVRYGVRNLDYRYDERRLLIKLLENDEPLIENVYDAAGRLLKQTAHQAEEVSRSVEKTADGKVLIDKQGERFVKKYYDKENRLTRTEDHTRAASLYKYDNNGELVSAETTLANGGQAKWEAAADKSKIVVQDPRHNRTEMRFDSDRKFTEMLINNRRVAQYQYGENGQLTEINYEGGYGERYEYDGLGNLIRYRRSAPESPDRDVLEMHADSQQQATTFAHPALGALQEIRGAEQTALIHQGAALRCQYDGEGRPAKLETPDGASMNYSYQANNRLKAIEISKDGRRSGVDLSREDQVVQRNFYGGEKTFELSANGQLHKVIGANQAQTALTYEDNRVRRIKLPDGRCVEFLYDKATGYLREERIVPGAK